MCENNKKKGACEVSTFLGVMKILSLYLRISVNLCSCKSQGNYRWIVAHYFEEDWAFKASI